MRFGAVALVVVVSCVSEAPEQRPSQLADSVGLEPALEYGRFFARVPGSVAENDLVVASFDVDISTDPQAVHSHLAVTISNPNSTQMEAFLRLPAPPGAAITNATLDVDDRRMNGVFVARDRAQAIYRAIVTRRRDPMLVTWSAPDWIDITIFPVE